MDSDDAEDYVPILERDDEDLFDGESSNSDYHPGAEELDVHQDDSSQSDIIAPEDCMQDEADYLTGMSAGETEAEGGDDSDASDLFGEEFDPAEALAAMEEQADGSNGHAQPYQVLTGRRAASRKAAAPGQLAAKKSKQAVFGADADELAMLTDEFGLDNNRPRSRRRRRSRSAPRRQRRVMSKEAEDLLGQANLLYATNRNQEALDLLLEVIRLAPNSADPYHTIGTIHEAMGEPRKALDFYMIAAHLPPKDMDLWKRLAAMSTEQGFLRQAIYCHNKVLFTERDNLHAQWDRAILYSDVNEPRKAIASFEKIHKLRPSDGECVKVLSRLYYRVKEVTKARKVLEDLLERHPEAADLTHVNILAELQMDAGNWQLAAATIADAAQQMCPDTGLPVDLEVKAGFCAARRGDEAGARQHFEALLGEECGEYGDLYLEVADLWLSLGRQEEALVFLQQVRESGSQFDGPSVWRRLAATLQAVGDIKGAISMYQEVVAGLEEGTAEFMEATIALADLLCLVGAADEASQLLLGSLQQDADAQPEPLETVMRRAQLLLQLGQDNAFLDTIMPTVSATVRHFEGGPDAHAQLDPVVRRALRRRAKQRKMQLQQPSAAVSDAEERTMFQGYKVRDRRKAHVQEADAQADALLTDGGETEGEGEDGQAVMAQVLKDPEQFRLLIATGLALVRTGQAAEANHLCNACLTLFAKRWMDKSKRDTVRMIAAEASIAGGDANAALTHIKPVASRWPHSRSVWQSFCRILVLAGSVWHTNKFVRNLRHKHPDSLPIMLLLGHCHASQGTYNEALGQYFHAYQKDPRQPLPLLCLAVGFLNQSMSKREQGRHWLVLQAFAFMREYAQARRSPQEAAYNTARAAHQLGMLHLAAPLYERSLECVFCYNIRLYDDSWLSIQEAISSGQGSVAHACVVDWPMHETCLAAGDLQSSAPSSPSFSQEQCFVVTMCRSCSCKAGQRLVGVLACCCRGCSSLIAMAACRLDDPEADSDRSLRREAAHNLALIYTSSGSPHLARAVLRKHFIV